MLIKRLIIKNFGDIEELNFQPKEILNCVSETVGNAIAIVLNNQFIQKYFNTVELRADSYLYCEIYHYRRRIGTSNKDVYTVTVEGLAPPVYTKNGVVMKDCEVDGDPVLSRPYREDNLCLFRRDKNEDFLDYFGFVANYLRRSREYSSSFKDCLNNKVFAINTVKQLFVSFDNGGTQVYKKVMRRYLPFKDLSESDMFSARYGCFLLFNEMINYHNFSKKDEIVKAPIIVEGYLSGIDEDKSYRRCLLEKTRNIERQTFFVEKHPSQFEEITKEYY